MKKSLFCLIVAYSTCFASRSQVINNNGPRPEADAEIFQATIKNGLNANQFFIYIKPSQTIPVGSIIVAGAPQVTFSILGTTGTFNPIYAFGANTLNSTQQDAGGRRRMVLGPQGNTPGIALPWPAGQERLAYTINITGDDTVGARLESDNVNFGQFVFFMGDEPTSSDWTNYTDPFYISQGGMSREGQDGIFAFVTIPGINNIVTPVVFKSYKVKCSENGTVVTWSTASEINSSHFEIEKSEAGAWKKIGQVTAAGNTTDDRDYSYLDLEAGVAQYRIKQVDLDGRFVYTSIQQVSCEDKQVSVLLFPVPARDQINVAIRTSESMSSELQVIDMMGKLVLRQSIKLTHGTNTINLKLGHLASGEYMIRSTDQRLIINQKFSIIK